MAKERLDVVLVKKGLASSRELAKAYIMEGKVFVNDQKEDKAGKQVSEDDIIEVKGEKMKYVSRGGYKLEKAVSEFSLNLDGKTCIDVGASTGGFTDCMLQNNAAKVISVDVGYGQFAWKLRCDERVVVFEKTNIRYLEPEKLGEKCDFASIDVSFISLTKVIGPVLNLLKDNGEIVALIKPQFEAGKEKVGKKGVVKEKSTHIEVMEKITDFAFENDLTVKGLSFSPIKGPEGNIEYLIYMGKDGEGMTKEEAHQRILDMAEKSHLELKG